MNKIGIEIIPTEDGLRIESHTPVDDSFVNKINNPVNKDRINAHLKDLKCEHHIEVNNGPISVLVFSTYEKKTKKEFETMLKVIEAGHTSFIENIGRMPEFDVEEKKDEKGIETNEDRLTFVKTLLEDIVNDEVAGGDIMSTHKFPTPLGIIVPWGQISADLLQEMCELYLEKYERKAQ